MLAVICYLWDEPRSRWRHHYRYGADHVRVLQSMLARHLSVPHRFICVTDRPGELPDIVTRPLDSRLLIPGTRYPKLMTFRPDAATFFGADRLLMLDLDVVLTGSIDPLIAGDHEFCAWANPRFGRGTQIRSRFNSSAVYLHAGARAEIWCRFDSLRSPEEVRQAGYSYTDQAWMSRLVAPDEWAWTADDGVYSYQQDCRHALPTNARLVAFHGPVSPCMPHLQARHAWIRHHYR